MNSADIKVPVRALSATAREAARGHYDAAERLFAVVAQTTETPEIRELAETLGMMSVKVEGREYMLRQALDDLKAKNAALKESITLREEGGFLFCFIVFFSSLYTIILSYILYSNWHSRTTTHLVTLGLLVSLMVATGVFIRQHRQPLAVWGLTWKGGWGSLRESLLFSIPVALAGVALKWALIHLPATAFYGQPLFAPPCAGWVNLIYLFSAMTQEVFIRGFLQTSIERILTGKHRLWLAISTASLLFAVAHLHYAIPTMLATLLGGIFFGWLFHRQKTLVGVIVAHFLLGILYIDILRLIT